MGSQRECTRILGLDGIAAYRDHPVRVEVVESLNTMIKAVTRRARGMRDDTMLFLKLKWATARLIRYPTADLAALHRNRCGPADSS